MLYYHTHNANEMFKRFCGLGMRFIVYLVSLALSLAALSTLKLHKLLEWLTMVSIYFFLWLSHFYLRLVNILTRICERISASRNEYAMFNIIS